ncbi:hypothetical protein V8G54_017446 [Vigna mungo]|uniref:Uncharacterized protein n=1 Tax=Vigna mungo TaxID=3915 RepID=A0AAQ3S226_VIGMU
MQTLSTPPFILNTSLTSSCAFFITLGSFIISAIAQLMVVADVSPPAPNTSRIIALILSIVKQISLLLSSPSWNFRRTSTKSSSASPWPPLPLDFASLCSLMMSPNILSTCPCSLSSLGLKPVTI